MKAIKTFIFAVALLFTASVFAVVDVDLSTYSTGSRSSSDPAEVMATDGWVGGAFTISWSITNTTIFGNPALHYHYEITTTQKDPSHIIIEVSDTLTAADIYNASPDFEGPDTYGPSESNPMMPIVGIFGIKFDFGASGPFTVDFDSFRNAIWGDFYSKDGISLGVFATAYNTGFGTEPSASGPFKGWIPVPDTHNVVAPVPEPSTYLLLGTLLAVAMEIAARRRALA